MISFEKKLLLIIELLKNITYLFEIAPFILCLLFFKKINSKEMKVFFAYTIVNFLFVVLALIALYILKSFPYNLISIRIFIGLEFLLVAVFYSTIIKNFTVGLIIKVSIVLYLLYSFYNFYKSPPGQFDFIPLVIECLLFCTLIMYYFFETMRITVSIPLYQLPTFWISVGFLIYFSGNFFLFLYANNSIKNPAFAAQYTLIYSSITIVKNILLCIGVITNKNLITKDQHSIPVNLNLDSF